MLPDLPKSDQLSILSCICKYIPHEKDDFQLDKMIGELYPLLEAKFEEKSQKISPGDPFGQPVVLWGCFTSQSGPGQSVKQRSEIFRGSHGDHFNSRGNKAF